MYMKAYYAIIKNKEVVLTALTWWEGRRGVSESLLCAEGEVRKETAC